MHFKTATTIGTLVSVLSIGACNRDVSERPATTAAEEKVDRAAELQRERDSEIARLDQRVADIQREYAEANQKVVSGNKTATAALREEVKEDVTGVQQAVSDLRTTTAENWWARHEAAMNHTADDIEADVKRLAGRIAAPAPKATGTAGEDVNTAPFTSRRDRFVSDLRARVDAMQNALDGVKASNARKTELNDTSERVKKLGDDLDRLRAASADDWWNVTKARVAEYLDRVEDSIKRLDDNTKA